MFFIAMRKTHIAIIGGGPAAMMLACRLDSSAFDIAMYEKNAAPGRKFLVAGKGGFNLTHSEDERQFADRYTPEHFMAPFLRAFSNTDLRTWLKEIGIDTYVGTSRRVFPVKGIKPIEVLKAIENRLFANSVQVHYHHEWKGWEGSDLLFDCRGERLLVSPDITVFALGGASWKVTGSSGDWDPLFREKGILVNEFYPSNCAYRIDWDPGFIRAHAGSPLKNCLFRCGHAERKGEAVLTDFGIEGSGIYPLSAAIRESLIGKGSAELLIDLKPDLDKEEIRERLQNRGSQSVKEVLAKKLNLSAVQVELLKYDTTKEAYHDPVALSAIIKAFPLSIRGFAPIDEAISTVGGIALEELSEELELKKLPGHYAIGEMLDWDAPTGGYLLQACFSMGYALAQHLNRGALAFSV